MKSKKQFSRKNKSKKQIRKKIKGGVEISSDKTFTTPRGHHIPPPTPPLDDPIIESVVPDQLQHVNPVAPPLPPSSEGPIMGRVVSDLEGVPMGRVISDSVEVPITGRVVPNIPTSNTGISYAERGRREERRKKRLAEQGTRSRGRRRGSSTDLYGPGGPRMEVGQGVDVDCGSCTVMGGKRKTKKRKTRRLKTRRGKTRKH